MADEKKKSNDSLLSVSMEWMSLAMLCLATAVAFGSCASCRVIESAMDNGYPPPWTDCKCPEK